MSELLDGMAAGAAGAAVAVLIVYADVEPTLGLALMYALAAVVVAMAANRVARKEPRK